MDANNHIKCPDCEALVKLGSVGVANLGHHRGSEKCKVNKKKRGTVKALKRLQTTAHDFFRPCAPPVPAQVISPSPINPTSRPSQSISHTPSNTYSIIPMENLALKGCMEVHQILSKFFNRIKMLPISVGEAGDDHPLAQFSGDPVGCVGEDEDAWEKFNRPLDTVLQKHPEEFHELVRVGDRGLIGLHRLLEYLVIHHGIQGGLIENKIERLMWAMDEM